MQVQVPVRSGVPTRGQDRQHILLATTDAQVAATFRLQASALALSADSLCIVADATDATSTAGGPGAIERPVHLALVEDDGGIAPDLWHAVLRELPHLQSARLVALSRMGTPRHLALLRAGFDDVVPLPLPESIAGSHVLLRQLAHAERDAAQRTDAANRDRGYAALTDLLQRLRGGHASAGVSDAHWQAFVADSLIAALAGLMPDLHCTVWNLNVLVPYCVTQYPPTTQPATPLDTKLLTALRWVPMAGRLPHSVLQDPARHPEPWRTLGGSAAPAGCTAWLWPLSLADVRGAPGVLLLIHGAGSGGESLPDALTRMQVLDLVAAARDALEQITASEHGLPADDAAWHAMVAHVPEAMFTLDQHGTLLAANLGLASMTGRSLTEVQSCSVFDLLAPSSRAIVQQQMQVQSRAIGLPTGITAADEAAAGATAVELLLPDGRLRAADLTLRVLRVGGSDGDVVLAGVFHDPRGTDRMAREFHAMLDVVRLMASERDLERAIAGVGQVLVERGGFYSGQVLTVTEDGQRLLARSLTVGGEPILVPVDRSIIGRVARERRAEMIPDVHADPDYYEVDPRVTSGVYVPMLRDSRLIGVLAIEEVREDAFDEHDLTFLQSMASLMSILVERAELYTHLEHEATTDFVTQLPNRQMLQQRLDATVEQMQRQAAAIAVANARIGTGTLRSNTPVATVPAVAAGPQEQVSMLIAGIDSFKVINELYGHTTADDILRQIGATLRAALPPQHLVARHTSDQFAILLRHTDRDAAVRIAEDLRIAVATSLYTAAEQVEQVTMSVGSATWPDDVATVPGLLLAADHAMFLAKRAGRNQVFQSNKAFATLAPAHGRITHLLRQSPRETLSMLVRAMDQRLPERHGHSERVARYAVALAHATGFRDEDLSRLRLAAYIHDIGMVSLPDSLLRKPGSLTPDEREQLRRVPLAARDLLMQLDEFPVLILRAVVHQRERWDGTGDPDHLAGEAIPRGAQVIAVADALDAMLHARAHRAPVTFDVALAQIRERAGTQFDPRLAEAAAGLRPIVEAVMQEEQQSTVG